mmetsp:Transcript_18999/g.48227  ORF Transcript_18999/g.48227 Transcript_18999/m.48227 type:complete len:460 (+) Transcript_18999:2973-4352(+)
MLRTLIANNLACKGYYFNPWRAAAPAQPLVEALPSCQPSKAHAARSQRNASTSSSSNGGSDNYDVIVLGLGAFGSSAAYHLAKMGASVLGLERFPHPGHSMGSSHGHTRIIRLAYFEGPEYVPLLKRSYALFQQLQGEVGQQLLKKTGMLDIGPGPVFEGALRSARLHNLEHEVLTGPQVNARFPGYHVPEHWRAVYQPDGGMLLPERIIEAHCSLAQVHGAELRFGQQVVSWRALGSGPSGGVEVRTASGEVVRAAQMIVAAGPWMADLVPETKALCVPIRQVVGWFEVAKRGTFHADNFPVFIIQGDNPADCWYGFPQYGPQPGFKIGRYNHLNEVVHPDSLDRSHLTPADEEALRAAVRQYFPGADGKLLARSTCMFTNTPDNHFIIDRHPRHPQVLLCSACSGHGFKMASGVGQLLAEHVEQESNPAEHEELKLHRINPDRPGHAELLRAFQGSS